MNYLEKLRQSAKKNNSIACMGLDPIVEAMLEKYIEYGISGFPDFLQEIFREMKDQNVNAGAFKPNQGAYLKHNKPRSRIFSGSLALSRVMDMIEEMFPGTPIILDYKRGDIAKTSKNYAEEGFEAWKADAVTISPYMGTDSVMPFAEYCNNEKGKGVYILNRTSNEGAKDFQNLRAILEDPVRLAEELELRLYKYFKNGSFAIRNEKMYPDWILSPDDNFVKKGMIDTFRDTINDETMPLYMAVANKIIGWAKDKLGVGAVVGATSLDELADLARRYAFEKNIPLLIPGVGGQGGKADEVITILRDADYDLNLVRINSSSDLTHPWAKKKQPAPKDYAKVCVEELNKLNEAIGFKP